MLIKQAITLTNDYSFYITPLLKNKHKQNLFKNAKENTFKNVLSKLLVISLNFNVSNIFP